MPFVRTVDPEARLVPISVFDMIHDVATVIALGTIAYISFAAGSPGWMIFGAIVAFGAIGNFIDFLSRLF